MDQDSQLLKGVLTPLILSLLEDRESYGYQLVTDIRATGLAAFPEGSIYPALGRFERQGYIRSRLAASDRGPARKYYSITEDGAELLRERRLAWQALVRAVGTISEPRERGRPPGAVVSRAGSTDRKEAVMSDRAGLLRRLERRLRREGVPPTRREEILAEVGQALAEDAAAVGEEEAIARFGDVDAVARKYAAIERECGPRRPRYLAGAL